MQQPAIEPDVDCHQHGAGPLISAVVLAEDRGGCGRDSTFDCQERASDIHHRHARNPRRPRVTCTEISTVTGASSFFWQHWWLCLVAVAFAPR